MRKWTTWFVVLSLVVFSFAGTAQEASAKGKHDDKKKKEQKASQQECKMPPGLYIALENVKNEKAKASIKAAIKKQEEKCEKEKKKDKDKDDDKKPTAEQRVALDKEWLKLGFSGSDTAASVTSKLTLAAKGKNGSAITWTSSRTDLVAVNGTIVKRPETDQQVILTATIKYGSAVTTKSFTVTVKAAAPVLTPAQIVAKDKNELQIGFNGTDTASSVTQPLKELPAKGANGSALTWISGSPSVISNDGKTVNRPAHGSGDVQVVMTVIIRSGDISDVKTFQLTVKQQLSDAQKVAADKAALELGFAGSDTAARITRPLASVPVTGVNGSAVTWLSSNPAVLSADGKTVNRPAVGSADAAVVLTAIITSGGSTDTKQFAVTVKAEFTAQEKLAADKADLAIGYAQGESASSVTKSITLATDGYYGSTVIWYSTHPGVVSNDGKTVNRPAHGSGDVQVTLMAYLTNGGFGDVKTFTVTVKQMPKA